VFFRALTVVLLAAPLFAQTDAIGVLASRTVELAPGEVIFNIGIAAETDVSLEQVLEAATTLGLTASNLGGIGSQQYGPLPNQSRLVYQFTFSVEFAKFRETNDKLAALRRTLPVNTPPMELQTFSVVIAPGQEAVARVRQRLLPELIADARARGEELARAAGVTLGRIIGLSEVSGAPASYVSVGPYGPSQLRNSFSLSVRFAVD
jgi:hypothetical protein